MRERALQKLLGGGDSGVNRRKLSSGLPWGRNVCHIENAEKGKIKLDQQRKTFRKLIPPKVVQRGMLYQRGKKITKTSINFPGESLGRMGEKGRKGESYSDVVIPAGGSSGEGPKKNAGKEKKNRKKERGTLQYNRLRQFKKISNLKNANNGGGIIT